MADHQLVVKGVEAVVDRETAMEMRRKAAAIHHHKDIWVKDPHGGPYRKVEARNDNMDNCPAGYEAVEVGPTTNFVGNAMVTGAVDLVYAELTLDRGAPALEHLSSTDDSHQAGPVLLSKSEAEPLVGPTFRPLERYEWSEEEDCVVVVVRLDRLLGSQLNPDGIWHQLHVTSASCTLDVGADGAPWRLSLDPLWAEVIPDECRSKLQAGSGQLVITLKKAEEKSWERLTAPRTVATILSSHDRCTTLTAADGIVSEVQGRVDPLAALRKMLRAQRR